MQNPEVTQPAPIDFSDQPEVIASLKTILGEIETVIDILQRDNIDFELFLKVNDGLLQDFRLAVSQYPEVQLFYEQNWCQLNTIETNQELFLEPEYLYKHKRELIKQLQQVHACIQAPILIIHETPKENINIDYVPQSINNDVAQGDDQLSIEDELQAIADVLLLRQLEPPVAVGILGTWGSGKSFGMHLIQKRMNEIRCAERQEFEAWGEGLETDDPNKDKKLSPYVGHIYQIKFNAWSYAKSNLWASLMEEIFSELNKQMTLERQLQTAGIDLLTGGKLWEALEKLNEGDRQYFLEQELDSITYEKLRNIELKSDLNNELMMTLRRSQNQALKDLQEQEKLLAETQKQLKQRQCTIAENMDSNLNVLLAASPELLHQVHHHFGKNIELKITEKIRLQDPDFDPQNIKDFIDILGESVNLFLGDRRPDVLSMSGLKHWLPKVWRHLTLLIILIIICILITWKIAPWLSHLVAFKSEADTWKNIFRLGILVPGTPAAFKLKDVLEHFRQWSRDANETLLATHEQLQKKMQLEIEKDPDVQRLNAQLITLKKNIITKRQKLPELQYDSLTEFLGDRLKPENYSNHLGMINQVQKDLQDLSDKLLPPKEKRDEKIKELFPRGEPRVILYIDDLDRCPPDRVVEVLEAVQLLLNTPLFVVILAVDDRYIARALEEVYSGVLKRRGKPSGIDYLEKIIQIPYRMRPISADNIGQYLRSQIQVISSKEVGTNNFSNPQKNQINSLHNQASEYEAIAPQISQEYFSTSQQQNQIIRPFENPGQTSIEPELKTNKITTNIHEINAITQPELELIITCCQYVDITPRTGKRLINIYKILKIIWDKRQHQGEPTPVTKQTMFSFLALSGRYPDLMRHLFEEIDTEFQESLDLQSQQFDLHYLLYKLKQQISPIDSHAQREWRKFTSDIKRMIYPNLFMLDRANFELALAFCFVGDIGYDPDDFCRNISKTSLTAEG